ncbi:hypothetical protein [Acinetobacter sp. YH12153]|uniref:hypothetical protein n=1 Tax=Acinetobacter sp. YH12153 TaxID=2601133 RepID=UPI0015D19A00|nr:hypothetical protein [Acinetobacter sp. YH12153]
MNKRIKYGSDIPLPPHLNPRNQSSNFRIILMPPDIPGRPYNSQRTLTYLIHQSTALRN